MRREVTVKITAEYLYEANACYSQIRKFEDEFPEGMETTKRNIQDALDIGLDIEWFGEMCLVGDAKKFFAVRENRADRAYYSDEISITENQKAIVQALYDTILRYGKKALRTRFGW